MTYNDTGCVARAAQGSTEINDDHAPSLSIHIYLSTVKLGDRTPIVLILARPWPARLRQRNVE